MLTRDRVPFQCINTSSLPLGAGTLHSQARLQAAPQITQQLANFAMPSCAFKAAIVAVPLCPMCSSRRHATSAVHTLDNSTTASMTLY
jgi:hypothetical protein